MASTAGVVWLDVLPNMSGFGARLRTIVPIEGDRAGKATGDAMGEATNKSFASKVKSGIGTGLKVAGVAAGAAAGAAISKGIVDNIGIGKANDVLAAQMGLTAEESERVGKLAGTLYRDAYGESLEEVNSALRGVQGNIGDLGKFSDEAITSMGAKALDLATIMGEDVSAVTRGVGQLMRNDLAPNAEAAFDIITAAAQKLPESMQGELLETIEEYGGSLAELGLTGEQAFGALSAAVEAGARNVDLAADAFKEFSIRAIDGSATSIEGYKLIGLNAEEMAARIAEGGPAAAKATSEIIRGIAGMSDPIKQEAAGVALFGTQFEDMGVKAITAMDPLAASLGDVAGATEAMGETLNDNFAVRMETWKRTAMGFVQDGLMALVHGFEDGEVKSKGFMGVLERFGVVAREAFDYVKSDVLPRLREFGDELKSELVPALKDFGGFVKDDVAPALRDMSDFVKRNADFFVPFAAAIGAAVVAFKVYVTVQKAVIAVTAAWNAVLALNPIGLVVIAIAALVAGLVVAYKRSETFRDIVDNTWRVISHAAKVGWEQYYKPILGALGDAIQLGWGFFKTYLGVVQDVWAGVWQAVKFAWGNVLEPTLELLWDTIQFGWETFQKFRDITVEVWAKVKEVAGDGVRAVVGFFLDMADKVLGAADKAFGWIPGLGDKLDDAQAAFTKFRDNVNGALSGIKDREISIKAQLDAGATYLARSRGLNASQAAALARKLYGDSGFAEGGWTGPGSKYQPAGVVHADEFVVQKESRQSVERQFPGLLNYLNDYGTLPGYASGGHVRFDVNSSASAPGLTYMVDELNRASLRLIDEGAQSIEAMRKAVNNMGGGELGPGRQGAYGGVRAHVAAVGDLIKRMFGPLTVGGYSYRNVASTNKLSDHARGLALDFMTYSDRGKGTAIAANLLANRQKYRLSYVQWLQRIASGRTGYSWERQADRGSPTQNHMDHVHASFFDQGLAGPGGGLQPGWNLSYNGTGKVEPVLRADQAERLLRVVEGGSGGPQVVNHYDNVTVADVDEFMRVQERRSQDAITRYNLRAAVAGV